MTTIKIYYKDVPGHNLVSSKDGAKVWTKNIRSLNDDRKNSLFPLLDLLGIDYVFSQEPDALALIDVGSLHPSTQEFFKICSDASNTYKKAVIFSTQEPWQWPYVEKILNSFSNLFLFDCGTPLLNNKVYHDRYGNFPSFLCRALSPRLHITMQCGDDLAYKREYKKLYSCLLARWRIEKHLLFSMLSYNKLVDKGFVSFNTLLTPHEHEFARSDSDINNICEKFQDTINILLTNEPQDFKDYVYKGLRTFQSIKLNNDIFLDEAQFEHKSIADRPSVTWFDPLTRGLPKFIFEESCFSLICESFSGIILGQNSDGKFEPVNARSCISEKSITPIMNGHPWLVFGEAGYYSTLESYGFISHDELFNLDFDLDLSHGSRLRALKNNMQSLEFSQLRGTLWNQNSETNKKIRHNRQNLFHMNSNMWKILRTDILNIFNRVRDFNV